MYEHTKIRTIDTNKIDQRTRERRFAYLNLKTPELPFRGTLPELYEWQFYCSCGIRVCYIASSPLFIIRCDHCNKSKQNPYIKEEY